MDIKNIYKTCQRKGCGEEFVTSRSHAKWCSKWCESNKHFVGPRPTRGKKAERNGSRSIKTCANKNCGMRFKGRGNYCSKACEWIDNPLTCALKGCNKKFIRKFGQQKYCSDQHRKEDRS